MLLRLWSVRCRCCFGCGCEGSSAVTGGSDGSTAASFVVAVVVTAMAVVGMLVVMVALVLICLVSVVMWVLQY